MIHKVHPTSFPSVSTKTVGTHLVYHSHCLFDLNFIFILVYCSTGEEWQKREEQRQQMLRQKLEHYSSLEKELQEALAQVQAQQKQLSERETKVLW